MILKAPKIPINIFFFVIGVVCTLGIKMMTAPIIANAEVSTKTFSGKLLNNMNSRGEIAIGKDIYFSTYDLIIIAEKIVKDKIKLEKINEVN